MTQGKVVTLAVYTFAICTIMGRQLLDPSRGLKGNSVDMYVPTFTILHFFFYMGWLKVAESLINPFGEDDDDFDTNYLVDRNVQGAYVIVDEMHEEHPELIKDMYFEDVVPAALPFTIASEHFRSNQAANHGSTMAVKIAEPLQEIIEPLIEDKSHRVVHTVVGGLVQENHKEKSLKVGMLIWVTRSSGQSAIATFIRRRKKSFFTRAADKSSPKKSR
ncbi:hypothetical protein HAZT_HAZT006174, partial [Hyalella azteca]